jgi:hypothetical protein
MTFVDTAEDNPTDKDESVATALDTSEDNALDNKAWVLCPVDKALDNITAVEMVVDNAEDN